MIIRRRAFLAAGGAALAAPAFAQQLPSINVSPGALTNRDGGKGGQIIRVTTLNPDGPGSITEAIRTKGKRIVVFEIGGVIDLGMKMLRIDEPYITIAGQTAPSPGITFIRGGISIRSNVTRIEHIAVRPGEAGQAKKSGWECDGISAYAARDVVVQNCSITWATDEGLSASGPRFGVGEKGATVEDWRAGTSGNISFTANIVAEGLSNSTHFKGEHSKGTLIHDNVRRAYVARSLYAHNMERSILLKGGADGMMEENVVYNSGKRFAHYNLHAGEWDGHNFQMGKFQIQRNIFLAGASTDPRAAAFMLGGDGPLQLTMKENLALDAKGGPLPQYGVFGSKKAHLHDEAGEAARNNPSDQTRLRGVMQRVLDTCGARPWDRDPIDARIVADVRNGTGRIIDSEQEVGGYPVRPETRAPFVEADWDLDALTRKSSPG